MLSNVKQNICIYEYKTKDERRHLYQSTLQLQQFQLQNEVESSGFLSTLSGVGQCSRWHCSKKSASGRSSVMVQRMDVSVRCNLDKTRSDSDAVTGCVLRMVSSQYRRLKTWRCCNCKLQTAECSRSSVRRCSAAVAVRCQCHIIYSIAKISWNSRLDLSLDWLLFCHSLQCFLKLHYARVLCKLISIYCNFICILSGVIIKTNEWMLTKKPEQLQTYAFCEHTMQQHAMYWGHPTGGELTALPLASFKGVASWRWGKGTRRGEERDRKGREEEWMLTLRWKVVAKPLKLLAYRRRWHGILVVRDHR